MSKESGEVRRAAEDLPAHPLVSRVRSATPIATLIGIVVDEIGGGRAIASLQAGPQHANPMGTLHGGVVCDVADLAMGAAFASTLMAEESFTTVALSVNFFRPVRHAWIRAEARVVNRGRNLGFLECEVTDEAGKFIAKVTSTCVVLRGEGARR